MKISETNLNKSDLNFHTPASYFRSTHECMRMLLITYIRICLVNCFNMAVVFVKVMIKPDGLSGRISERLHPEHCIYINR